VTTSPVQPRESNSVAPLLMLDPSLFLSFRSLRRVSAALDAGDLTNVVVPKSFVSALDSELSMDAGLRYFGAPRKELEDLRYGRSFLTEVKRLPVFEPTGRDVVGPDFRTTLGKTEQNRHILAILEEEWFFLNSQSWLASRTRKAFSAFIRAGAVAIEGGRELFDTAVMRTLKMSPETVPLGLARGQRLRAAAKWIAVGGHKCNGIASPTFRRNSGRHYRVLSVI